MKGVVDEYDFFSFFKVKIDERYKTDVYPVLYDEIPIVT